MSEETGPVTELFLAARGGKPGALDRLFPLVYAELRRVAHNQLRREREEHTLGTTGLVHETYLRLVDQSRVEYRDRYGTSNGSPARATSTAPPSHAIRSAGRTS